MTFYSVLCKVFHSSSFSWYTC